MIARNRGRVGCESPYCQAGRTYRRKRRLRMELAVLGIDVGKTEFHCALSMAGRIHWNHFANSLGGFSRLRTWVRNRKVGRVHACLEATGGWSEELATDLHNHGHLVSIVNPVAIKAFGQS